MLLLRIGRKVERQRVAASRGGRGQGIAGGVFGRGGRGGSGKLKME
jgi:hypothetical protein